MKSLLPIALSALFLVSCDPTITGPDGDMLDVTLLAKKIEDRLRDSCVGYQFVIYHDGKVKALRAGGDARLSYETSPRKMSTDDKYNIASVSKTITAAALLHALNKRGLTENDTIGPYLPKHWSVPSKTKKLTFKELLQHKSGFRTTYGSDYASLKKLFVEGPTNDKSTFYNNANYAIMRMLIAHLSGAAITAVPPNASATEIANIETKQASEYSEAYMKYCQANVFDKVPGCSNMACKPTETHPALAYQFPKDGAKGTDFGDMTLTNAERGWHMSSLQMANFLASLHDKGAIISKNLADKMRDDLMGYDFNTQTNAGHRYFYKGGLYPGKRADGTKWNDGELNSALIAFTKSGLSVGLIVNSQYRRNNAYENPLYAVLKAYDEWYK